MNKVHKIIMAAGIALATAFTFSCSSGGGGGGNICNPEDEHCVNGEISSSGGNNQGGRSSSSGGGNQGGGSGWAQVANTTFGEAAIYDIAYGGGKFVAVSSGQSRQMAYSADGINWTAVDVSSIFDEYVHDIAYGNDKFVAVGYHGKMAYSADGETWTAVANSTFGTTDIFKIAYGNDKFVAMGVDEDNYAEKILTSTNGINWTAVTAGTDAPRVSFYAIAAIAYGNNKFVAVWGTGAGAVWTSTNGTSWTAVANSIFGTSEILNGNPIGINAVAYGGGKWVIGGDFGKIAYSTGN